MKPTNQTQQQNEPNPPNKQTKPNNKQTPAALLLVTGTVCQNLAMLFFTDGYPQMMVCLY